MVRDAFLAGARTVLAALSSPAVAAAWDEPSVLAEQTVGSLAGHLARGGVWVVGDYLDADAPAGATYATAAGYFARLGEQLDDAGHRAIRERGATVAGAGHAVVVEQLASRLVALEHRLPGEPPDRIVPVAGGSMALDAYLETRLVEQVVHLDDLDRSLGGATWQVPAEHVALVLTVGTLAGMRRHGAAAMLRAVFRDGPTAGVLPVL